MKEGDSVDFSNPGEINYHLRKNEAKMGIESTGLFISAFLALRFLDKSGIFSESPAKSIDLLSLVYYSLSGSVGMQFAKNFNIDFNQRKEVLNKARVKLLPVKGTLFKRIKS
jgi:hypothetical protein